MNEASAGEATTVDPAAAVADLSDEQRSALRRLILGLADTKRLLGIRYSDWLLGAPSIETGIAASSMCQDEWGHARLLYAMLKEFGEDPTHVEHDREPTEYGSADALDGECSDWPSVVAMNVIVDGALSVALQAFGAGRYEMARSRVPKMLAEEEFHRDFGRAWFRRLAAAPGAREFLSAAVAHSLPRTLAWLAPDDDAHRMLVAAGLTSPAAELVVSLRDEVGDLLAGLGLEVDASAADRTEWNSDRGRGPGGPDSDAIARARGDLNRELFVE